MTATVTQASMDAMAQRVARLEQLREEDARKVRLATIGLGAAVVVTAFGVRAANRRSASTCIMVPNGHSVVTMPPGQSHVNR